MNCPLDYSLCDRTVTVYRMEAGKVRRFVVDSTFLSVKTVKQSHQDGESVAKPFLLILPGGDVTVYPGDRVFEGVGPHITEEGWSGFLPATVPELFAVEYVKPYYWMGKICHIEAGSTFR